jgi:hypothetical protein
MHIEAGWRMVTMRVLANDAAPKAGHGNRGLRTILVGRGQAAGHTRKTALAAIYRRMIIRAGRKHAALAIDRRVLKIASHLLPQHRTYGELGPSFRINVLLSFFIALGSCSLNAEQRAATISFGHALEDHGQLITEETTYIRSEVKAERVLVLSLPNAQSAALFNQGGYKNLAAGLPEPRIENLVQIGGAAGKFGETLAKVADLTSSTADEKIFSTATRQLIQSASAIGNIAGGVGVGAPVVNLATFTLTERYRLRYLRQAMPAAEPAFRSALKDVSAAFDPENSHSLLCAFESATDGLSTMLQASAEPQNVAVPAFDRATIANGYRLVTRDDDHIKYVTGRQFELTNKAGAAYNALVAALQGDESHLNAVDAYSSAVFQVRLALQSLK